MGQELREEINRLHAGICKALADPNRILLLYTLAGGPQNVSQLTDNLALPQPTVSRHLKTLRSQRMVTARRQGQTVTYILADPRIIQALDLLRAFMGDSLESQVALAETVTEMRTA